MTRVLAPALVMVACSGCCQRSDTSATTSSAATTPAATTTVAAPAATPAAVGADGLPLDIPTTRSPAPSAGEWASAAALRVPSARPLHCEVNMIREWVRVNCAGKRTTGGTPQALEKRDGCSRDTYTSMRTAANLVTALTPGVHCEVEFTWTDGKQVFVAEWPRGARPGLGFVPVDSTPAPSASAPIRIRGTLPIRRP